MAEITAKMVSQLREETGAGMMDCKRALTEANGDMQEAQTILRKKGAAKADKRGAERTASEGVVSEFVSESGGVGVLLELNCETDFVARNEDFRTLAHDLAREVANAQGTYNDINALLAAKATTGGAEGGTVNDILIETASRLGEKVAIARYVRFDAPTASGAIGAYVHRTDHKTGVLVEVATEGASGNIDALTELAREVSLHIAASRPEYLTKSEVPGVLLDKEREIARAKQDADPSFANKPEAAKTAMIEGQVRKYLEQTVLLEQPFVRDPSGKQKVSSLVADTAKKVGVPVSITRFTRYKVGETVAVVTESSDNV